jgi:trans-aconitate methyltransferase
MPIWVWIFIVFAGALFALKMTYVLCTALALPTTWGALYVSTTRTRITAFIEAVPLKPDQTFVDLGCGDGRVLRLARKYCQVRAVGFEVNLLAYLKARLQSMGLSGLEIKRKNFWRQNLAFADIVFCYLYPDVMQRLAAKLQSELRPGTLIASCNFPLPGFEPIRVIRPEGALHSDPLYIYRA